MPRQPPQQNRRSLPSTTARHDEEGGLGSPQWKHANSATADEFRCASLSEAGRIVRRGAVPAIAVGGTFQLGSVCVSTPCRRPEADRRWRQVDDAREQRPVFLPGIHADQRVGVAEERLVDLGPVLGRQLRFGERH